MSKTKIFDDSQIATIHLTTVGEGGQAHFDDMLQKPEGALPVQVDFRYINHKLIHTVRNITLSISGKSSMEFNKMAFKLRFYNDRVAAPGESSGFFKRPNIKLRSETSDPVSHIPGDRSSSWHNRIRETKSVVTDGSFFCLVSSTYRP